jgi:hypothetical protein
MVTGMANSCLLLAAAISSRQQRSELGQKVNKALNPGAPPPPAGYPTD